MTGKDGHIMEAEIRCKIGGMYIKYGRKTFMIIRGLMIMKETKQNRQNIRRIKEYTHHIMSYIYKYFSIRIKSSLYFVIVHSPWVGQAGQTVYGVRACYNFFCCGLSFHN